MTDRKLCVRCRNRAHGHIPLLWSAERGLEGWWHLRCFKAAFRESLGNVQAPRAVLNGNEYAEEAETEGVSAARPEADGSGVRVTATSRNDQHGPERRG